MRASLEKELAEKIKIITRRRFLHRLVKPLNAGTARNTAAPGGTEARASGTTSSKPAAISGAANFVPSAVPTGRPVRDLVVIGVSTGGPPVVQKVLSGLPKDFPAAIFIAQHMPGAFTGPFAKRLDSICAIDVKEAEDGDRARPGAAYIAPGGKHIRLFQGRPQVEIQVTTSPEDALYKPSATVLIGSAGNLFAKRTLGVMLTGMGSDGLEGTKILKAKGGRMLAQSDATCVVYGMPKAVVDAQLADEIVDIDDMALAIRINLYK
jgi:two-component system chemotaxis response regulator CheB